METLQAKSQSVIHVEGPTPRFCIDQRTRQSEEFAEIQIIIEDYINGQIVWCGSGEGHETGKG